MYNEVNQCNVCKRDYTSMHVEYKPGVKLYVCPSCMEKTRDNYIWLCVNCGSSYMRPKETVISKLENSGMENASLLREGMQLIMGIDMCIACNPEGVMEYVSSERVESAAQIA